MIRHPEIWKILVSKMPHDKWVSLHDTYQLIERYGDLDEEDAEPQSPGSGIPKWKRDVRNVLQYRKNNREILWDGKAGYRLPFVHG